MPKYIVRIPYCVWIDVTLEAADSEEAEEKAIDEFGGLSAYAGNGGTSKLVGTSHKNCSVYACDEHLDSTTNIKVDVEKV